MNLASKSDRYGRVLCALILCVLIAAWSACTGQTGAGDAELNADPQAQAVLRQIDAETRQRQTVSNETFEALKKLREKYPDSEILRGHMKNALIFRSDMAALRELLIEDGVPPSDQEDKKTLAKVDVELGNFAEAAPILEELVKADPNNVELRGLAGLTQFRLGNNDRAAENFDAVWKEIIDKKMVPEISIRGLIYLNQGELEKAKETLETAIEFDPDHISANNSLSRVYGLLGNEEKARELSRKVADLQEKMAAGTLAKSRRVAQKLELEKAYENKRYQEVIDLAERLLAGAESPSERSVLLQYQFNSYKSLGMNDKAEAVRQKAASLAQ
ncbi:MAG: tetratricopeptide repeat protein [Aridibacter famidurans]|nr:tetratricopeptide repeat protein [Aridibacter famidurans]